MKKNIGKFLNKCTILRLKIQIAILEKSADFFEKIAEYFNENKA